MLGDWDGDGREDLLIVHGDVRVLFDNKGDRKFGKRWEDPNKYKASHAALGTDHRNINGSKNLYATPRDGANLFVRYPDSEGFSEVVVQHPFPSVEGFDGKGDKLIRAVELNADDHDDLVIGTPVGLFVYRSQDLGGFTSPEWVASRNTKKIFGGTMPGILTALGPNSENEIVLVEAKADGRVLAYASDRDPVGDWSFDGVIERLNRPGFPGGSII